MLLSYLRTILLYLILILVVRLMGKRQIGEMEPAEFVVTMLIANLAAIPMQDSGIPLLSGLVPILTVLGVQLILAVASMRFIAFRRLLCGKPVILISEGKIDQVNLRRARITLDELTEHLRERRSWIWARCQYAILETNGQISVFPYPQYKPASAKDAGAPGSRSRVCRLPSSRTGGSWRPIWPWQGGTGPGWGMNCAAGAALSKTRTY